MSWLAPAAAGDNGFSMARHSSALASRFVAVDSQDKELLQDFLQAAGRQSEDREAMPVTSPLKPKSIKHTVSFFLLENNCFCSNR